MRADCFLPDGVYLMVPLAGKATIQEILELAKMHLDAWEVDEEIVEIQTDDGIWMVDEGFKTWEQLESEESPGEGWPDGY